jgi:succinate dehydrogenase / fumarate reductase cytochrome b subunit
MQKALTLYETTIGKKAVMALTGLVLFGFVIGHMLGNLQVYLGADQLNGYAKHLKDLGPLLWAIRVFLGAMFVVHMVAAVQLWLPTFRARGKGYRRKRDVATDYAARTMWLSGPILLLFVAFHLAQFTFPGVAMSDGYGFSHADVYANVVNGFSVPWVTALYVLAQATLGIHLYHGAWSLLQSLGFNHPQYHDQARFAAQFVTAMVVVGNISIPLAVLAGLVS